MTEWHWERIADGQRPGGLTRAAACYDSERDAVVLFGGLRKSEPGAKAMPTDETWEYRAGAWHKFDGRPAPPARHRSAMVFDKRSNRCVLFGGQAHNPQTGTWPFLDDTWEFDGRGWNRCSGILDALFKGRKPKYRCAPSFAFHEGLGAAVLYGGAHGGGAVGDTWIREGKRWRLHAEGSDLGSREYAPMVYDSSRQACVLYGGNLEDSGSTLADTWLFDGFVWSQLRLENDAGRRDDQGLCFFGGSVQAPVMFGSLGAGWTCRLGEREWERLGCDQAPSRRQCMSMVFHEGLNAAFLFGGETRHGGDLLGDTWLLRAPQD